MVMHRADLQRLLVQAAEKLGVRIRLDSAIRRIDFSTPSIELQSGETLLFDAIFGADGLKSPCRSLMHGRTDPPLFLGDVAYRVVIEKKDLSGDEGIKNLIAEEAINVWLGPDAHIVMYPLGRTELLNMVVAFSDDKSQDNAEHRDTVPNHIGRLRKFFESWDPRVSKLLLHAQQASRWELGFCDEMQDWIHVDGKFGLVGDACHAMLPYLYVYDDFRENSLACLITAT